MNNPGKLHWEAVKWIRRYLQGTTGKALCFKGGDTVRPEKFQFLEKGQNRNFDYKIVILVKNP